MDNQDIQENQVTIVNESEKNPRLVSLEGHYSEERKSSAKERQESSSNLIQSYIRKVKRNLERENLLQIAALREKSPQKLHYTQRRKRNMVRGEDEIILQLLGIHPHLMDTIQMTHNMRGLK